MRRHPRTASRGASAAVAEKIYVVFGGELKLLESYMGGVVVKDKDMRLVVLRLLVMF